MQTNQRPLRIALVSYRSRPYVGGQGIYLRHLSRELAALGHHVEVLSDSPGVRNGSESRYRSRLGSVRSTGIC